MAYYDPYYPRYKEGCYWYGEWLDTGARIPYCKCKKEKEVIGPKDCENCAEYHNKYKRTNADCIRSWSDEEIAEFTIGVADGVFKLLTGEKMPDDKREEMKMQWLDWLKQEVSESSD